MMSMLLHFLIISAGVSATLAASTEQDRQTILRRGLKTWATLVIAGTVFAIVVEVAQRPSDLFFIF